MGNTNILDLNNRLTKVEKNVAPNSYTSLKNKPKINSVTLTGNKTLADIGAAAAADLGNKSNLTTTDKSSVVGAINEVNASKINKTAIQIGRNKFPSAEVGVQTVTVTFPTAFAHTPQVMVSWDDTPRLTEFFKYPLSITNTTTTGFTVKAERLNAGDNWWFRYIAVDNQ